MVKFSSFLALSLVIPMWKMFYMLASMKNFYALSGRFLPWLFAFTIVSFGVGLTLGLVFAPADYQQGDAFRIIYIHIPSAFLSLSIYAGMGLMAISLLVWRVQVAGVLITALAEIGVLMTAIALITGSLWGKPMWGTWWIWDARLTSEFILLLMYFSVLAIKQTFAQPEQAYRLMAIVVLVGVIDLPIIHYSVYWWNTLHQGQTLSLFAKPKIAASMLYPLLIMLSGFVSYVLWATLMRARQEILRVSYKQNWVKEL